MQKGEISSYLGPDIEKVRKMMEASLSSDIDLLNATNRTLMEHGGKFLRPILAMLVAKAISGGTLTRDTYLFATATELLHNATLLHDDVADNSPSRRGVPTPMAVLGPRPSVLLGDFWLVKAVDRILSADRNENEVLRLFAKTLSDLAEGEMLQLEKSMKGDTTQGDYYRIIYNKTASLFEAGMISAAISVSATESMKKSVKDYARYLGMAFQIRDDIMDYEGGDIGKPAGQDLEEGKITLPLLGALSNAPEGEASDIRKAVVGKRNDPSVRRDIVSFVERYGGMQYAREYLAEFSSKAVASLEGIPSGYDRDCLGHLAEYISSGKA